MPAKRKVKPHAERLEKGIRPAKKSSRLGRARKDSLREVAGSDTGRALAIERELSPLARLMGALRAEKIDFILIGMSAAVLQGVPTSTVDVDYWINLPPRQYMRAINVCRQQGATPIANTVVELEDGTLVNFVYTVTGLGDFASELRKSRSLDFKGLKVPVLSLQQVLKSKREIMRPKDATHIEMIEQTLKGIASNKTKKAKAK